MRPSSGALLPGGTRTFAIAIAFALGAGLGALAMHRAGRDPVPVEATPPAIEHDDPNALAELTTSVPPLVLPRTPPAPPVEARRLAANGHRVPAAPASMPEASSRAAVDPVADERRLLDEARVAVEREDGAAALAATEAHARAYPRGVLVQEREAIAVRALVELGRVDEARGRVGRFRERFPDSLLLPALESTVAAPSMP